MQALQAQADGTANKRINGVLLERIEAIFASLRERLTWVKANPAEPCEGHAWCDSMERQLVDDVASYRRTRF